MDGENGVPRRIQHGTGTGTGCPERGRQQCATQVVLGPLGTSMQHSDTDVQINLTLSFYSAAAD